MSDLALGRRLIERLEALACVSGDADGLTRLYLSPAHKRAADALAAWMREAGMTGADGCTRHAGRALRD